MSMPREYFLYTRPPSWHFKILYNIVDAYSAPGGIVKFYIFLCARSLLAFFHFYNILL